MLYLRLLSVGVYDRKRIMVENWRIIACIQGEMMIKRPLSPWLET